MTGDLNRPGNDTQICNAAYSARVKRLIGHAPTCMFRDEENPDEFYVAGASLRRDALGRKGSTWTWQTYLCNDPDCPGTVMVRGDVMKDLIAEALRV